jgi:hypothetical protein
MEISKQALLEIIPYKELQRTKLTIPAALVITRRHYCSQMTTHNLCTAECLKCSDRLREAVQGLESLSRAEGMFVTRLRHQVAEALEEIDAQKEPTVKTNLFGEKDTSADLFADLLTGLP